MAVVEPFQAAAVQGDEALLSELAEDVRLAVLPLSRQASASRSSGRYLAVPSGDGAVLFGPDGTVLLEQPPVFLSRKRERLGEGMFSVADTTLGRVGLIVGDDISFFESARCLAMRGAEILCHLADEPWSDTTELLGEVKAACAAFGQCWLISANRHGCSSILDYAGRTLAAIPGPGAATVTAWLDVERLRVERGHGVTIANNNSPLWAEEYARPRAAGKPSALPYAVKP